jgi:molybdenum cofactor guanylyltransferase
MLQYYEKPQRYHVYDMLQPFCEKVFISCSESQADGIAVGYHFLTDLPMYKNTGPMAALLTAFTMFPGKNILSIGCDYPFLTAPDLEQFSKYCTEENAVAFYNEKEELYEPMLAWYPHQSVDRMKKMQVEKQYSLQHFLRDTGAIKFYPKNKKSITSVNTTEEFVKASNSIKSS